MIDTKPSEDSVRKSFIGAVLILFFTGIIHAVLVSGNRHLPVGLLYSPVLLYMHFSLSGRKFTRRMVFLSLSPFCIFLVFFLYTIYIGDRERLEWPVYNPLYFGAMIAQYNATTLYIFSHKKEWKTTVGWFHHRLLLLLNTLSLMIGLLLSCILLSLAGFMAYEKVFLDTIVSLMLLSLLLKAHYLWQAWRRQGREAASTEAIPESREGTNLRTPSDLFKEYAERLTETIEKEELFRQYDLSADILSEKTGIPRHHLSELFHRHLHTSFYHYVASYRITYALRRLKEDGSLTLEGLTYESGFNSSSTFSKYFKAITGYSLSEYRKRQENNKRQEGGTGR